MKIKFYGTRGSIPISNPDSVRYGGNTTCVRINDPSVPKNMALVIDSGSGFVPLAKEILKEKDKTEVLILYTHYHSDHTIGLFLSPITFIKHFNITLLGPLENDRGAREMMENIMIAPYFPVDVREVKSHFTYKGIRTPNARVLIVHPEGFTVLDIDHFDLIVKHGEYIVIGKGKFPLNECLVVKMFKTNHPEKTLSYSLKNMKTGKKFVFLTDHENSDGVSKIMKEHVEEADLLVMDCQYTRKKYDNGFSGYGHGTPDYVTRIATSCNVKMLGLTHHDPDSTDSQIDDIVNEATMSRTKESFPNKIFACKDYQEIEL